MIYLRPPQKVALTTSNESFRTHVINFFTFLECHIYTSIRLVMTFSAFVCQNEILLPKMDNARYNHHRN